MGIVSWLRTQSTSNAPIAKLRTSLRKGEIDLSRDDVKKLREAGLDSGDIAKQYCFIKSKDIFGSDLCLLRKRKVSSQGVTADNSYNTANIPNDAPKAPSTPEQSSRKAFSVTPKQKKLKTSPVGVASEPECGSNKDAIVRRHVRLRNALLGDVLDSEESSDDAITQIDTKSSNAVDGNATDGNQLVDHGGEPDDSPTQVSFDDNEDEREEVQIVTEEDIDHILDAKVTATNMNVGQVKPVIDANQPKNVKFDACASCSFNGKDGPISPRTWARRRRCSRLHCLDHNGDEDDPYKHFCFRSQKSYHNILSNNRPKSFIG